MAFLSLSVSVPALSSVAEPWDSRSGYRCNLHREFRLRDNVHAQSWAKTINRILYLPGKRSPANRVSMRYRRISQSGSLREAVPRQGTLAFRRRTQEVQMLVGHRWCRSHFPENESAAVNDMSELNNSTRPHRVGDTVGIVGSRARKGADLDR